MRLDVPRCAFMCQGAPSCAKVHLHVPRCTFVCQGAPSCAKVRFGRRLKNKMRPRCVFEIRDVPLKVRFHVPRRTLESQGAPWPHFVFPRCTLGAFCISKVHLGTLRRTLALLGTLRRTLALQGAPLHIKAHLMRLEMSRWTLGNSSGPHLHLKARN